VSHSYELNEVLDLVDEQERKLVRLIGTVAYAKGVRALLEQGALRAWKRGDEARRRKAMGTNKPLPKGVRDRSNDTSQRATPIFSPRVAREVDALGPLPVKLDEERRRRGRK